MSSNDIKIEELISYVKEDSKLKIVIIGDSGIGKTCLVKRFIQDGLDSNKKPTEGLDLFSKNLKINDNVFRIEIWDASGDKKYRTIRPAYYKGANGAIVVYDVTSKTSFDSVDNYISELKEIVSTDIKIMMIGNKIDLKDEKEVSTEEALSKGKYFELPLVEASAIDSTNVKQAFYDFIKEIYKIVKKQKDIDEQTEK